MPFLRHMSNRVAGVWDFISPRKTQMRRDKPFRIPAMPVHPIERSSPAMTPVSKMQCWAPKTPASAASVDDTLLPPSPPSSLHRYEDGDYDFDGDTIVQDSVENFQRDDAADAWDANDNTMVVDDGQYMVMHKPMDHHKEQHRQVAQSRELRLAGWPEDAVFLFQKLNMRGSEPILPYDWNVDFPSLPLFLFTKSEAKQFIRAEFLSDFRAQYALTRLLNVGGLTRDAILTRAPRRTAERHILGAVKEYSQWAMRDGGMRHLYKNLQIYTTIACDKNTPSYVAEQRMIRKLYKLRQRWEGAILAHDVTGLVAAPEELPTLYGVIASHTVMAFVSYVLPTSSSPKGSLRTVAIFDFGGDEGFDVWNSFAIAIFVIHCRNRMQELKEFLPEPIIGHHHDPDL